MKKLLFIFNPRSGKAQIKSRLADILDLFIKNGYQVEVHVTQGPKDATMAAGTLGKDVDLIVCGGGDGTLNETVNGMMKLEFPPLLGYIPSGSTNDFASSLQIPKNIMAAAHTAIKGDAYAVDIGSFCDESYFVYIAAFGAFTEVSYMTPQDKKNFLGHQAYMLESVKSIASIKPYRLRVECDELILEGEFIFGMVTNTISVGGFKGLVPQDVALNDGEFEVLLIKMPKTPIDLSNIISYMFLKEEDNEYVHKFRTRALRIIPKEPMDWVLDGEFGGCKNDIRITNLRKQIKIMRNPVENR